MNGDTGQFLSGVRDRGRWKLLLDVCSSIAVIAAAGIFVWKTLSTRPEVTIGRAEAPIPSQPLLLDGASIKGNPETAKAAILEFADFQCPYCAKFLRAHCQVSLDMLNAEI